MKDLTITVGVAAALMTGACNSQPQDNGWTADKDTAICVDKAGNRVPDAQCPQQRHATAGSFGSPFLWYFLGRQSAVPYYGERVFGGSYAPTVGRNYFRAPAGSARVAPAGFTRGASVSRGGFGSSAHSFGSALG